MQQRTKIAIAVALALPMMTAIAQETVQRVEVTGSRIRQVDLETAQPVLVMTQEQIQRSGLVTVGEILNNMTAAGAPSFSKTSPLTSNRESGGEYVSLRNLGGNRLLVLVNGKRWTQSVAGYTDMSTIPSAMIERIDVLKDGASTLYGSDAIAGVVNIILKKSMTGGALSLYTGRNEEGDGRNKDFSLTYGAGDEKASLMFGYAHTETGEVMAITRDITATSYGPAHPYSGLGGGPWGRITAVNPATGGSLTNAAQGGFNKILNHTGNWERGGVGADSRDPNNYHNFNSAYEDLYNSSQDMHMVMPSKLDTIFVKGEMALPFDLNFKSTAMYSARKSVSQIAGYPLTSTSQAAYPVYVDKDSYYNPYGNQVQGAGNGQDLFFARRVIEMNRMTYNTNRTLHIDGAVEGEFNLMGNPWNWSVGYNHNRVQGDTSGGGNINLLNLKKALGPSFMSASGVVQCGTPANPIGLSECVPWNILGGPSASTPEALAFVNTNSSATYGSTINSATADMSGELFSLPAGKVGLAVGLERREVKGYDVPGQFEQSGYSTNLAGNATYGRYTVREAYAELGIPLLKNLPLAESLNLSLATRHSDYSNFGVTNNSKASITWKPIKDLMTRFNWGEGFRAPTLGDTFGGGSQSFDTYLDPCDTVFGQASKDASVLARCQSGFGGVAATPAGFRQLQQSGAPIASVGGAQTPTAFNGGAGNAFLRPETAVTKTAGFVYSPSFLPGFSASVDWFNISIENRITGISASYVANQCYVNGVTDFCAAFRRDPVTGMINQLSRGNANLGFMETEGVDFEIKYRLPRTSFGQFSIRNETAYLDSFRTRSTATADWTEYAGDYYYHRVKSNMTIDWAMGDWSATWGMRYRSPGKDDCWSATEECSNPDGKVSWGTGYNKLGSTTYHDLSVGYKTTWNGHIRVGINNLFDKKPRILYGTAASASSVDGDVPLDRFFYVRYNQQF